MESPQDYKGLTTPVALFIFRRPDTTQRVLQAIARAKPPVLFVVADGPRNAEEVELCAQARAVIDHVDWECEVIKNYSEVNLGLRERVSSGLDWVFEQVEQAIILEDDCLPHETFFRFCEELLNKYRDEPKVMHISGDCFVKRHDSTPGYYFSRYAHVWGWATWKRAWKLYDGDLATWNEIHQQKRFLQRFSTKAEKQFWEITLEQISKECINTWDYQWAYSCLKRDALAVNPTLNLVSNIGFDQQATHTFQEQNSLANLPTYEMKFPLIHSPNITRDIVADQEVAQMFFMAEMDTVGWRQRLKSILSFSYPGMSK